tara:strand:+ start:553 stop:951 length:399 start_codon:yes stop_codon:yes gene_type:complete
MKILDLKYKTLIFLISILGMSSCSSTKKVVIENENRSFDLTTNRGIQRTAFTGWWVYGEGHHIFKDEETLEEYDLIFPEENMEELVELYLAVCEMEYFPMECEMTGYIFYIDKVPVLQVSNFEILYIQGCGE